MKYRIVHSVNCSQITSISFKQIPLMTMTHGPRQRSDSRETAPGHCRLHPGVDSTHATGPSIHKRQAVGSGRNSWPSCKGVGPESERSRVRFPNWSWVKPWASFSSYTASDHPPVMGTWCIDSKWDRQLLAPSSTHAICVTLNIRTLLYFYLSTGGKILSEQKKPSPIIHLQMEKDVM
jgi:hypothetical protein